MAQFEQHFVQDLTQQIKVRHCGSIVFNADNESNVVSVRLFNGSEPVAISGSVVGAVVCSDGSTVPLTGSYSGNTASITLTGDCFAVLGQIGVGIQIVNGTQKTTVLKVIYNVETLTTENVVDPGSRITLEVGDLIAAIDEAVATIPEDYSALSAHFPATGKFVVGTNTSATEENAVAEGEDTIASGLSSHAEGYASEASGDYSHSEGGSIASGGYSHAEGSASEASGDNAHAEGYETTASSDNSHSEGWGTTASGMNAHAEGIDTVASGNQSHAEGEGTIANHAAQSVSGTYNVADPSQAAATAKGTYAEIVGNGIDDDTRSNARTLDWSGNEELAGDLTINKNGQNEMTVGEELSNLKSASVEYHSMNLFDKSAAQDGYQINGVVGDTEVLYANSIRVVSDLIPCTNGDSFYITRIDSSNAFGNISNSNFVCAVALDSAGKILKRSEWVNPFTVDVNAVNVRFCITSSVFTNNKIVNITKNYYPTTKKPVDDYAEYMVARNQVNTHVIDLWGDSRIENGATENTDIGYYLQGLTNTGIEQTPTYGILYNAPGYTVCNNGIGAQASGMVAARLGSNDVYVTLYENQIRATGESLVTGLRCSTGQEANFNSWSVQAEKGVPCILCGVHGWLVRSQNTIKFIRNTDGNAVTVRQRTKIDVLDKHSGNHICVLWAGKNDMTLADGFQVNGVIGNMAGMVQYLHHDKFIVLGETYDNDTSTYGTGKAYRGYVDEINNWYKAHYPNNFINIQTELVTNGLTIAGITPTAQDETDISNGFIPSSLMQDDTHPNAAGREVIAKILSAWMKAKGWIE